MDAKEIAVIGERLKARGLRLRQVDEEHGLITFHDAAFADVRDEQFNRWLNGDPDAEADCVARAMVAVINDAATCDEHPEGDGPDEGDDWWFGENACVCGVWRQGTTASEFVAAEDLDPKELQLRPGERPVW